MGRLQDVTDELRHPDTPPPGTVLGPHYVNCFGCGPEQEHGLHLQVVVGEGATITARFTVTSAHQGAPGLAHGGVLTAAFDEAMGALLWVVRRRAVTGHLETSFRRPVPVGSTLVIHAQCTGIEGRRIHTSATGHLDTDDGPLAVSSKAMFVEVRPEHFTRYAQGLPQELLLERFAQGGYNP